jgi:hypothetical protein
MWPHFVNLLHQSSQNFLAGLSATALSWWVQGIVWFFATETATYAVIWAKRGKDAMKAHVAENFKIGFYVWLVVMVCVYGPIFGWYLVKAVYDDHQALAATVTRLANEPKPICPTCAACPTPKPCKVSGLNSTPDEEKKRLREALGKFVQRGMTIRDQCGQPGINRTQLETKGQAWGDEVVAYLRANVDSSYIEQFRLTHTELNPSDIPAEMLPFWHGMNERVQTLDRFIDQLK